MRARIADSSNFLIVNGVAFPMPLVGVEIIHSQTVDAGRNANNAVIGQKVGRKLWKLNNLQWAMVDPETWKMMKDALADFYVPVTFTGDDNVRHTITMYPSDTTGKPMYVEGMSYTKFENCKFNLIDCGWETND